ncbi:MAG: FAD-dependent oxidoreductase, partial [Cocleimonas sp.]|nr:FAD-dependent oxidoreductase [Cocleimonas sp.]
MNKNKKIVIVGGVAGGASVAARLRRLSESVDIIMLQRGRYVSFANCGLPYHIGGEIKDREQLLIQTPEGLNNIFNIDVRIRTEALSIDKVNKQLTIKNLQSGEVYQESYDELVLSPGAAPIAPPIPGIDREGHYALRTIGDMDKIMGWNDKTNPLNVAVIGGGFIGLEMVEQLAHLGMEVSLVEAQNQVLPPLDVEVAQHVENQLKDKNINVYLKSKVVSFDDPNEKETAKASVLVFDNGIRLPADLVILSMGVRPETELAQNAQLEIGKFGGIRVNDYMQTTDPHIWAVGDVIETRNPVSGEWALIPLAGPANRQGRTVADNIMGRKTRYRGTWGTSVLRVFDLTIASTGLNEKQLKQAGMDYKAVQVHPYSHVTYYPNAEMMLIKLLFSPENGTIYGAQIIGKDAVERRLDILATAIQGNLTIDDVAHLELSYAPAYGSPKDPVNYAAMAARNILNGDMEVTEGYDLVAPSAEDFILDVRSTAEYNTQSIPNAIHIPLEELRKRLDEIPKDKMITTYCLSGQRSYFAYRLLMQKGFQVRNLCGGIRSWSIDRETINQKSSVLDTLSEEKTPNESLIKIDKTIEKQHSNEEWLKIKPKKLDYKKIHTLNVENITLKMEQ